jgi:hypothetical protein
VGGGGERGGQDIISIAQTISVIETSFMIYFGPNFGDFQDLGSPVVAL